ncbi:hypothetical protein PMAYCL1PPCAC_25725, partial [Pristionchus mayeri]
TLCCFHAKRCQKKGCKIPFCGSRFRKMMEQKRLKPEKANAASSSTTGPSTSNISQKKDGRWERKTVKSERKNTSDKEIKDGNAKVRNIIFR